MKLSLTAKSNATKLGPELNKLPGKNGEFLHMPPHDGGVVLRKVVLGIVWGVSPGYSFSSCVGRDCGGGC